jgi:flagellar biosynthesis protein FlhG
MTATNDRLADDRFATDGRANDRLAHPARLTAVASGKGGVGKTWFAITLAHAWAKRGRRVLLADGDFGLANIDIQLGLPPAPGLGAVLAGRLTLAQAALSLPGLGFDVLAGHSGNPMLTNLAPASVDALADGLRMLPYDDIVLDLGAGLDPATRRLAARADRLLVLVTDEPTSLTDGYAVIKLNAADAPAADMRVVVNQAASREAGQRTYATLARACAHFLHRTPALAGIIRRDDRVRDAIRHQTALLTRHPNSQAASDVDDAAATLLETACAMAGNSSSQ